jgi:L-ascorbate metabolism protein UlaG (beta-lactamase superfamily)
MITNCFDRVKIFRRVRYFRMKITKFGHCCLSVEERGVRILVDPGNYTSAQNEAKGIHIVLITHHEHRDHLDMESLKRVLKNNPSAKVMTNRSAGAVLEKEGIPYVALEDGQSTVENGVRIEAFGKKHAVIYPTLPAIDNTGYFIANRFFYPGDALTNPNKPVEILAFPVTAVWLKLSEAIDYVKQIKPKICFPVHEGNLKSPGSVYTRPSTLLGELGIKFIVPVDGEEMVFNP